MRRREGIQLFSTSSIDLLACGLGAVLVLWLLVFGNEGGAADGERALGSGEIRIRQFGTSHLIGFEIDDYELDKYTERRSDKADSHDATRFNPGTSFADTGKCYSGGAKPNFTAIYEKTGGASRIEISCKASESFAKEIAVRFSDMTSAHAVSLTLQTCSAHEIHYLEVQTIDRRGVNETRYVFHCKSYADQALGKKPSSPWERYFQQSIREEISKMCPSDGWEKPFHYRVYDCARNVPLTTELRFTGDGAVRFGEPDFNPAAQPLETINGDRIRDRIYAWSGGTYGAGRLPEGLPACPKP